MVGRELEGASTGTKGSEGFWQVAGVRGTWHGSMSAGVVGVGQEDWYCFGQGARVWLEGAGT